MAKTIREQVPESAEAVVIQQMRRDLRRLLGGLRARDQKAVERELAGVIERAYKASRLSVPEWAAGLGKRQV